MTRHRSLKGEMPFLDHLEELRWRILWSLVAITIFSIIGFALVYYFDVLDRLIEPIRVARDEPDLQLIYLSPAAPFFVKIKLGIYGGIIMAFPILAYQMWSFMSPALDKSEKRAIVPALYLGMLLFIAGVAMAYFAALPVTLEFFKTFEGEALSAQLEINETLGFIVKILIGFGAVFEMPVVIMVLTALGLVTPKFLREKRRHAIVANTVLASFITPGDVITLTIMLLVPLLLLYELSIFLSAGIYNRRQKRHEEDSAPLEPTDEPPPGSVQAG